MANSRSSTLQLLGICVFLSIFTMMIIGITRYSPSRSNSPQYNVRKQPTELLSEVKHRVPPFVVNRSTVLQLGLDTTTSQQNARIPHRIHQTWDSLQIQEEFVPNIKSWLETHPDWEYWFWTDADIEFLIRKCYPQTYLDMYLKYAEKINRVDSMRHFVLYLFGGLYADLDMVALKGHDELVDNNPCIVTQETFEHSVLLYGNAEFPNLLNAYLACRPLHPFMRSMISSLPASAHSMGFLLVAGPLYETKVLKNYIHRGNNSKARLDEVRVLHPKFVVPTYDKEQIHNFIKACNRSSGGHPLRQEVCQNLKWRLKHNVAGDEAFANHLWTHVYMVRQKWNAMPRVNLDSFVSQRVNVTDRILKLCPA